MDHKNGFGSKPKGTICEKFLVAIRATTPFRNFRLQHREDAAVASATSPHVSMVTPPPLRDRCARVTKQSVSVPVAFDTSTHHPSPINHKLANHSNGKKNDPKTYANVGKEKVPIVLPIHGQENRVPSLVPPGEKINSIFSEYIERAGRKIRSPTIVGARKPSVKGDSFNDKVSEFINGTKHKFHTAPSTVGNVTKTANFKDEGTDKGRRIK